MNHSFSPTKIIILFLFVLGVYLKTLAPHVFVGDSSELISAASTLGVAHPTSYPLFVIAGKIFSLLPVASPAFRLNCFSAILSAFSVIVFLLILERSNVSQCLSLCGSLLFAFSLTFWSQAVITRVYSLNMLLTCLVIYFITLPNYKYLVLFFFGLGAANHYFILLVTPLLLVYYVKNRQGIDIKSLLLLLFVLILAASLYLELPIRAQTDPPLNWRNPSGITDFLDNVTQKSYSSKIANRSAGDVLWLAYNLLLSLGPEYFYVGTVLMILGMIYWFSKARWLVGGLLMMIIGNFVLIAMYGMPREFYLVYFLPTFLALGFTVAAGIQYLVNILPSNLKNVATAFAFLLVIIQVSLNYYPNNRRWHLLAYDIAHNILNIMPPNAILYVYGDAKTFTMAYQTYIENRRPDLLIAGAGFTLPDKRVLDHQLKHGFRKNVFTSYLRSLMSLEKDPSLQFIPTGLVWQQVKKDTTPYILNGPDRYYRHRELRADYYMDQKTKFVLNYYNLNEAATLIAKGQGKRAIPFLVTAYQRSGGVEEILFHAGRLFMEIEEIEWAYKAFYKSVAVNPNYKPALQNLASMSQLLGKLDEAITYYQRLIRMDKNYYRAIYNLGNTYAHNQNFALARLQFENFLKVVPSKEVALIAEVKNKLRMLPSN